VQVGVGGIIGAGSEPLMGRTVTVIVCEDFDLASDMHLGRCIGREAWGFRFFRGGGASGRNVHRLVRGGVVGGGRW